MSIAILDAAYSDSAASASCVAIDDWSAERAASETAIKRGPARAYEPGAFYKRELPLLLDVLKSAGLAPKTVVIDGYVWLDGAGKPGLGAHLHVALGGSCAVVGVAKTTFAGADSWAAKVLRGSAARPLYVTAIGVGLTEAAGAVQIMHGKHRIPALIQRADRLAREALI